MKNSNPTIFLPGGRAAVRRRDVQEMTSADMAIIRQFHRVAQKFNLVLSCVNCGHPMVGRNSGHERVLQIECQCREIRGENRGSID